jgi:autotransporter-associated beta strand protein
VFLGDNKLTVGSNNLSTNFSGVMRNAFLGDHGSLTKVGSGTLVLSGANTYTGNTNVGAGVLQVDGSITSNTYVNAGGTLAGTGTVSRNVTDTTGGTVSPGHALGLLSVNGNYRQASYATLLISIAGLSTGQFSVLDVAGTANLVGAYDLLDPVLLNGFVPTIGESFTFLNYASLNGTFFISDANIDNLNAHWEVTYQPTYAILTVALGNVPIVPLPDQGFNISAPDVGLARLDGVSATVAAWAVLSVVRVIVERCFLAPHSTENAMP